MKRKLDLLGIINYGAAILTLIFVVLKAFKLISWSWWLVFLPVIITQGILFGIIVVVVIISLVKVIYELIK